MKPVISALGLFAAGNPFLIKALSCISWKATSHKNKPSPKSNW